MKVKMRLLVGLMTLVGIYTGFSQSLFDKFEDDDSVTTVVVSQKMFQMFSKIQTDDKEANEFMDIAKKLSGLKVFTTSNKSTAKAMKQDVDNYLKKSSLQELMRVKDKKANIKFYVREGKNEDSVSELLMFIDGISQASQGKAETVLLTLTGDIDLNKIGLLTKKMNLPTELEEVESK